jgi:hypothetical protein
LFADAMRDCSSVSLQKKSREKKTNRDAVLRITTTRGKQGKTGRDILEFTTQSEFLGVHFCELFRGRSFIIKIPLKLVVELH